MGWGSHLEVGHEGESLPGEGLAALPQTVAPVGLLAAVGRGPVVEHLRRRLEPPAEREGSVVRVMGHTLRPP